MFRPKTDAMQLEEFEVAVNSSYSNRAADDSKDRHRDFITAIGSNISKIETSLTESAASQGKPPLPWVRLDEGERDELAMFLSAPSTSSSADKASWKLHSKEQQMASTQECDKQSEHTCSRNSPESAGCCQLENKEEKLPGHRRTASANADISSWKIAVIDDSFPQSSNMQVYPPPRKIPSFSGFLNTLESAAKSKWPKNAYRKIKLTDRHAEADTTLPQSQPLARVGT